MNDLLKNSHSSHLGSSVNFKKALLIAQFFLIIFVYHMLKDLKDTLVITSSEAGAQVIPFLKIWVILPFAVFASYIFAKVYQRYGREKTLYIFLSTLLLAYVLFAFVLYPLHEQLYWQSMHDVLTAILPIGCKGFISITSHWIYTFFYLAAELWSMMILSVLFWGYLNEITSPEEARSFYPLCVFAGNCAGILSGQISRYMCHTLMNVLTWQQTLQILVMIVSVCGLGIMFINWILSHSVVVSVVSHLDKVSHKPAKGSLRENILCICKSTPLLCIAILVVGFALTSNLIEVVWKETIRQVYPSPQSYNAYVNQLTSLIGTGAVIMSLLARYIFRFLSWSKVALITPVTLFVTSFCFFFSLHMPGETLSPYASFFGMKALYFVMTLGSIYYVLALVAKYTIFDMCKEMAFLSIDASERMKAKSVIDSVGSRLGKSGSSCLYQALLITFGSTAGHVSIVGLTAVCVIGISIIATRKLGQHMSRRGENFIPVEAVA